MWKCLTAFSRWLFSHNSSIIDIWEYPKFAYFSSHTFLLHIFLTCGALLSSKQIFKSLKINNFHTLFKKCPNTEFFSGRYFPAFGLNTEIYSVNISVQSECRKYEPEKDPYLDTFHKVIVGKSNSLFWTSAVTAS